MQHGEFATKISEIATKFSYLVAKLRLDFFVNFEPCLVNTFLTSSAGYYIAIFKPLNIPRLQFALLYARCSLRNYIKSNSEQGSQPKKTSLAAS